MAARFSGVKVKRLAEILQAYPVDEKFSARTGLSLERLRDIQRGSSATVGEAERIAKALKIDLRELASASTNTGGIDFFFRDAQHKSDFLVATKLSSRIASSMKLLPERDIAGPWWLGQFRKDELSFETAEENARAFRRLFANDDQLGPLLRLPEITVNTMGVLLFLIGSERIDGASTFVEGIPYIFLANRFAPRMLFTLAHELGHLLVQRDARVPSLNVDTIAERKKSAKNIIEFYAHCFASSLLMPSRGVGITLQQIRAHNKSPDQELGDLEISFLARIYGVSFYVAARRCEDLKLLPRGGAASLEHALRKKFGSAEKRGELANLPTRPEISFPGVPEPLLVSALARIKSGEISIGKASEVLGISVLDLLKVNAPVVN
jgi:Zn-dependent peptidase ImmA (M78 family)